jgi:long-chain acyl-CoA synthetase
MYGATEASARLTWLDPDYFEQKIDSIGQAIPGVTIKILDDQGREVAQGAKGEVVASGPTSCRGIGGTRKPRQKPWMKTVITPAMWDIRTRMAFIFLEGSKDNLLKVGGHRINPQEVEDALLATGLAGAEHCVTGSCHLLQANGLNIMVDCGLAQGTMPL